MIGFFEVINISAPHIYHSALPQSPQTSSIRKLYEPYACPFTRVVQGIPISWEPVVATVSHRGYICGAVWSPCSRYIAVSQYHPTMIEILDPATLEQLHTFKPRSTNGWLSFSPDSHLLTQFGDDREVTTWDLQTGGQISTIPPTLNLSSECFSSTYSIDGKMAAAAYQDPYNDVTISTYNLLSGTHGYSHHVLGGHVVAPIWTDGECLQFVTLKPGNITVWQVGFTPIHTLTKVETFPTPYKIKYSRNISFLPTHSLFAFPGQGIWDVRDSRLLLKIPNSDSYSRMSFSSDGHFFVCGHPYAGIHLWEESPAGYVPCRELGSGIGYRRTLLLSPNGKSIIASGDHETWLWHTTDPITSSSVSTLPTGDSRFLLDFSPDGSLAATAREWGNMAVVLDLKSGNPRLVIDTGMKIRDLWVTGDIITVFDEEKVIAWKLSGGDHVLNARVTINNSVWSIFDGMKLIAWKLSGGDHVPNVRATINDSVWSIMLNYSVLGSSYRHTAAISRDLNYIVILSWLSRGSHQLGIYNIPTGNHLVGVIAQDAHTLWITPDGCGVGFSARGGHMGGWKIAKDGKSNVIVLECLPETTCLPDGYPWGSVTDDGWILNLRKKRLMWLPHHWRKLDELDQTWDGQFLGLLNSRLPEPIIVELDL